MNVNIIATILFVLFDIIWIYFLMNDKYNIMVSSIQGGVPMQSNLWYSIVTYIFLLIGLNILLIPNLNNENIYWYPFVFGLVVYGVFSFTNAAIFKEWDLSVALLDTLWGAFLYFITIFLSMKIYC